MISYENAANAAGRTVEWIVVVCVGSAEQALSVVEDQAKAEKHSARNSEGVRCTFEFIGVLDLLQLGSGAEI